MRRQGHHYRSTGRVACPARCPAALTALLFVLLVPVETGTHRLELTAALQPVLAADARRHFRHGAQSRGSDRLVALLAESVLSAAKPFERLGQFVGPLDEQASGGEAHFAI